MTSVLRNFWPGASSSKNDDHDDEYSVEYSFAVEYSGPPLSHEIPQVVPVDVRRIPTAAVAANAVIISNLAIPVLQPIGRKSDKSGNNSSIERKLSTGSRVGESVRDRGVYSSKLESFSEKEGVLEGRSVDAHNVFGESSSSSGTMGFSDGRDDSNQLSGSSDCEEMGEENKANVLNDDLSETTTCNSIEELEEECEAEASGAASRAPVVTFRDLSLTDSASEESDQDEAVMSPERPALVEDVKGLCHRCSRKERFADREVCIVCNAKYCSRCVLRAMGSMPEGRKCNTCIGHRIHEPKRGTLGKSSRMMKKMLTRDAVKKIMSAELSCPVNQLPPHLIYVNDKPLSIEELVTLQSCSNPPKKLRPGRYWYDKVSGFWGKVRGRAVSWTLG